MSQLRTIAVRVQDQQQAGSAGLLEREVLSCAARPLRICAAITVLNGVAVTAAQDHSAAWLH